MAVNERLPRELKSAQTQKKIIDTSISILAQYDFKYLTVRNICDEANVAYGSFYHHFKTKENVLLFCGKELLKANLKANPYPSAFNPTDYLHICIWYGIIVAMFCECLGKDFIRSIFLNNEGNQDLFEEVYTDFFSPALDVALQNGLIRNPPVDNSPIKQIAERTKKDLQIVTRGTALWWCCSDDGGRIEPFYETMEHIIFHTLFSTQSEAGKSNNYMPVRLHETTHFKDIKIIDFSELPAN